MDRKQIEEIAKKAYPITRKESHVTDLRLLNKRQKNIHNFIKGFEASQRYYYLLKIEFDESIKDIESLNKSIKCYKLEEQSYLIKIDKMKSLLKQVEIMMEQNNMNDDFNGIWRDSDETILENIKEIL